MQSLRLKYVKALQFYIMEHIKIKVILEILKLLNKYNLGMQLCTNGRVNRVYKSYYYLENVKTIVIHTSGVFYSVSSKKHRHIEFIV